MTFISVDKRNCNMLLFSIVMVICLFSDLMYFFQLHSNESRQEK